MCWLRFCPIPTASPDVNKHFGLPPATNFKQMKMDENFQLLFEGDGGRATKRVSVPYFWKGGTYGAETEWNEPKNWYNCFVPGWFDVVVISNDATDGRYFPTISAFANDIAQLIVEKGSRLTICREGKLSVDGLDKKGLGIMNDGEIIVEGELTVHRTIFASVRNKGYIFNSGSFAVDKKEERGIMHSSTGRFENYGELLFL